MSAIASPAKKPADFSLREDGMRESCEDACNPLAEVGAMLQADAVPGRQSLTRRRVQAHTSVACWNALHDMQGSFADAHSTL